MKYERELRESRDGQPTLTVELSRDALAWAMEVAGRRPADEAPSKELFYVAKAALETTG